MIDKMIQIRDIFEQSSQNLENWNKMIKQVQRSKITLFLKDVGFIKLVRDELCFFLNAMHLNNYSVAKQMPKTSQSKKQLKQISEFYRKTLQILSKYILKCISEVNHNKNILINLGTVGKLYLSFIIIKYKNNHHQWQYKKKTGKFFFPQFLCQSQIKSVNLLKISEKLSKSLSKESKNISKPVRSISDAKENKIFHNKSNINTSMMKKIRTEIITDKIIKPKSKILFIKSKNQKSQQKSQQSYYSAQKVNKIKNKKPLNNSSQEFKILSKYKLRLKIEDKCKIFDKNQETKEEVKQISRNILKKYISVVQKSQFQQYLQQVADIYFKICKQKKSKQIKSKLQQKIQYLPKINKSIFSSLYQITSSQEKIYEKIYLRSQKIFKRLKQSRKQVNLRQDLNLIVLIYNQAIKQMMIITKKSHFFAWKISKYFRQKYFQLLLTYQIFRTNSTIFLVQLICQKEWEKLSQDFGQNLKQIFLSLQQLINNFPVLAIQQWQFKRVNFIINSYKNSIKNSEKQFRERIAFELNFVNKCKIYQCFLKISQGKKYLQQIQNEYMQMVENFSTIIICNTLKVDITKLLQKFYILARNSLQNLYQNFYKMHSFFLLNINKKISMTECKIYSHKPDYLVQKKNFLWSQYKKMIQIIELFSQRKLPPFNWYEDQLKYQRMLQKTYHIKDSIQYHLRELQTKIKQQQAINIDHCQHLQQRHKKIQDNFKTLITSYNELIRQLKTKQDILQKQHSILDLYNIFKVYNSTQSILLSEMRERNIICLQKDDTVFEKLIILKQSLFFLQNPLYNQLRSIKYMNIQKFKQLLKLYEQFICRIKTSFIYNLFKYEYQLLRDYHHLAKLILYKGYNQRQLQIINELGLNLVEKNDSLIYLLQKYHSQLKSDHLKKIQKILVECQQNQLSQKSKIQIQQMQINLIATQNNLIRIATVDELYNKLQEIGSSYAEAIRCTLKILQQIWKQLQLCHFAFVKLQDIQEIECQRIKMIQQISSDYNKMIYFWIQHRRQPILRAQFQPFQHIIKDIRICQIEKICLYKIKMFPRLALLPTEVILSSDNWNSSEQITRNIRSLYQEVDKVIIEEQKIMGFVIGIEIIPLGTGIFVKRMQDCHQNSLELFHKLTMKCMQINLAKRQTCQMCLLTWFLWFTKNMEQYLIMQKSLAGLKKELIKATKNLLENKQLKKRQKQLELTQINMFINHLSALANVTQVTDYQVLRTIKVYKREKCVSIIQATKQFQYGFEPYKPLVINPSMILSTGIIYQLENRINNFQTTAYVLGQPCYKTNISGIDKLIYNSQIIIRVLVKNRYFMNLKQNQSVAWLNNLQAEFLTLQDNQKPCLLITCCKTQNMQGKHRIINSPNPSSILLIINKFTQYQMKNFHHNISIDMISIIVKNMHKFNLMTLQQQLLMINKLGDYLSQTRKEIQLESYLTQIFDNKNLQYRKQKVDEAIKQYISGEHNLIIYGPTSDKTYSIRENHLLNSQNQLTYFYEPKIIPKYKCIVEFQNLSNLDLNSLLNAKLLFRPVFEEYQLQQIFYHSFYKQIGKQSKIVVQKTLWSSMILIHQQYMKINYGFYQNMYKIHKNQSQSTLNLTHLTHMIHLIIKLFKFQLYKGLYQRKQIYTKFCNIVFQTYYYMLSNQLRQKFTIRVNQVGLNLRITLKSQNFYLQNSEPGVKIQSLRTNLFRLNSAQLCLTKRYLESGMNVLVHSKDIISLNHFQRLVRNVSKNSTTITLSTQVVCLKGMNGLLIVFDDQHLQDSQLLIQIKRNYQQSENDLKYLLMIRQNNISSLTRHLLKINLGSISSSSLYQYINKSPLKEQFIQKINQTSQQGELDCYHLKTLLIEMNMELSYKIYNKLYAIKLRSILNNQYNNLKFNLLSQINFQQTTFLLQTQSKYKIIHNTEIKQFCDLFCKDKSTLISCILQQYLLPLLQYCLIDELYIIIQQLPIIPYVIASIKQYPIFFVHQKNFILKIILILAQLKENTNFIVLFPHYIAEKQQFIQFISHFLKSIDFLQMLKLQEIEIFWSFQSIRKRFNYSTLFQRNRVLTRMSRSIIKHMKIIISVNTGINLSYPYTKNQKNLAQSELQLIRNFQHKFIKINGCISKEGKIKIINKLVQSYTNEIYLKQIQQLYGVILQIQDEVIIPVIRLEAVLSKISKIFKEGQFPKKQKCLSFQQYQSRQKLEITAGNTENNIKELELALFRCQKYLQKEIQLLKNFQSSEYQDGNINLNSQLSQIKASFISKSSLNVQNIYKMNQEQQFIILELQKILKEAELTNFCQIQKHYIKIKGLKSQIFYKLQSQSSILQNLRSLNAKSFHPNITQIINYLQYCTKVGQMYQHLNVSKIILEQESRLLQYYYLLDLIYILQNSKAILQKQRTEQLQLNYYLTFMKQEIDQIEQFSNKSNKFKKIYDIMYLNFAQLSPKNKKIVQIINKNFHQYYDYWIKTSTIYQNIVGLSQLIKFQEVKQSFKLAIYDPFNIFGQFCQKLKGIKILFVRKGQLQIVKQYQFQQTIYCIYLQNFQDLFNRQQQLQQIYNILALKYKTSSQKKYDKIAVIFTDYKLNNYISADYVYFQEKLKAQKICQTIKKQFIYQQQQKQTIIWFMKEIQGLNSEQIIQWIKSNKLRLKNFRTYFRQVTQCTDMKQNSSIHQKIIKLIENRQINYKHVSQFINQNNILQMIKQRNQQYVLSQLCCKKYQYNINKLKNCLKNNLICIIQNQNRDKKRKNVIQDLSKLKKSFKIVEKMHFGRNYRMMSNWLPYKDRVTEDRTHDIIWINQNNISEISISLFHTSSIIWL